MSKGYEIVPFGEASDVVLINTCTVTEEANRKCRKSVRKAIRNNADAFVIVTGCYAQLKPEEIAAIEGVDVVLGSNDKFELFNIVKSFSKEAKTQVAVSCIDENTAFQASFSDEQRTRAFLKVQDGCDYSCSFCTIPRARGRSRSASIESIVSQANQIATSGVSEIVLSGVNIGLFGEDNGVHLLDLLKELDADTSDDLLRFRISSIEPNLLTDEIIEFVGSSQKFVPHFHIPLQSGDDEILGLMRRRYKRDVYAKRIEKITSLLPNACIGSDVIVGFPGETDRHFENTVSFIDSLPVSYLHAFTYSERPETLAADILSPKLGAVRRSDRNRRNKILRALSEKKLAQFYRENIGTTRQVLWESFDGTNVSGYTDNYIRVEKRSSESLRRPNSA